MINITVLQDIGFWRQFLFINDISHDLRTMMQIFRKSSRKMVMLFLRINKCSKEIYINVNYEIKIKIIT